MRNWHKLTYLVIDSQRTLVGHYLWGIDTFNPMVANCKTTRSRILSDITYEELTHVDWYRLNHQLRCRTLPMRNWHKHSNSLMHWYLVRMYSRTLPMRNWHFLCSIFCWNSWFMISCRTLPMRNWHILIDSSVILESKSDITYEELTHFISFLIKVKHTTMIVGHYLWGIDTEYGELKNWEIIFIKTSIRRTLPMRNWHVYGIRTFQFVLSSGITFPTRIPCANT